MADNGRIAPKTTPPRLVLAGAIAVVLFWLADSVIDALLSDTAGGLLGALLLPEPNSFVLRLLTSSVLLGGSFYIERLVARRMRAETDLRRATYKLGLVYDHSPDAIFVLRRDLVVDYANAATELLTGKPASDIVGQPCHDALYGSAVTCEECAVEQVLRTGNPVVTTTERGYRPDMHACFEQTIYPVHDESGAVESVVKIVKDVTEVRQAERQLQEYGERLEQRVQERTSELERTNVALQAEIAERIAAEHALHESEARLRSLVELSPDLIMVHADGIILFVNPVGARLLGYRDSDDVVGRPVMEIVHADSVGAATNGLSAGTHDWGAPRLTELRLERADGSPVDVMTAATPLMFHGRPAIQAVAQDISARKAAEETVRRMAYYDTLTGLPNRALFDDRLTVAIHAAEREESSFAVLFLDIDDFKAANDAKGHAVGDEILTEFADRLKHAVRRSDTVARIGGDEFAVLLPRVNCEQTARQAIDKISAELALPVLTAGGVFPLRASIGVAFYPQNGQSFGVLMHAADMAMYSAKNAGERFRFAESDDIVCQP